MSRYIITITRQFGSLGRPIAKRLSELLGIEYYDRDIVERVARETGLSVTTVSDQEESEKNRFWEMAFPLGSGTTRVIKDEIFEVQKKIILDLANKESCIIVGRCSDYILRNYPNCYSIYIYASKEQRMKNCVNTLHLDEQTARKMIKSVDKARDSYHVKYAGYFPNDENHLNIMIDSGFLGIESTAKVLASVVREKLIVGDNPEMND